MKNSPPLKSLVYFESAMRLNSFSLAAAELFVTPGAVGQQIRSLEQWLGVALFTRHIRQVRPTEDGLAYWARIQPALAQINEASHTLRDRQSSSVWLTMPPGLAAKWFARRMSGFLRQHPAIALHLSSSVALVDFANERVDLAIRHFDGHAPELETHLLYQDQARLYCSPSYAARFGLKTPEDLRQTTLLHSTLHPHWNDWLTRFTAIPTGQVVQMAGIHFDQSLMAIEAARHDQGVVLTSPMLTEEEVSSGALIEPFSQRLPLAKGFYVVQPRLSTSRPAVEALKEWLIAEASTPPP
ncbi:LysR substrate-binding domain-containing protein [Pseudomonas sp. CCI3.2]|uniref:LysR substrate-binding domain-containing protein n=2 Tax=Pseudomonas TaxID=286 RepID=UPI002AC8E682|nr:MULTISPECIES: LysR substrate-binding domain-containing protein [unclassified Pseudomonas]MEB0079156.1 LysR substrate-binding domain-containing protein [Pseudomonas sp. MH10out]MEB0092400.1 LysR substrate-binding domain-containing protein [Pseudomonas sp. CCI4.2]MEB0102101.1 LysR substrate-binding domain-containing protein [Pseudomonas sp. CCI3.2]MEB0132256.1 LysR substrate-binding domain-containing protein [Pseudomonas sp. CCI2.4]MEB0159891.1 LysR substrate-binding domain-containing protein